VGRPRHRRTAHEALQEESGEQRASGGVADLRVLDVGDGGVELVLHVRRERQVPCELADAFRGGEVGGDGGVVAHDPGVSVPQRDDDRARERRDVDEHIRAGAARRDEAVRHDDAALGVGVGHLDARAVRDAHDVAGRSARPDGMFSARHSQPETRTGSASAAAARTTASTVAAPAMSNFIPTIPRAASTTDRRCRR
jgi:hypothetical protein